MRRSPSNKARADKSKLPQTIAHHALESRDPLHGGGLFKHCRGVGEAPLTGEVMNLRVAGVWRRGAFHEVGSLVSNQFYISVWVSDAFIRARRARPAVGASKPGDYKWTGSMVVAGGRERGRRFRRRASSLDAQVKKGRRVDRPQAHSRAVGRQAQRQSALRCLGCEARAVLTGPPPPVIIIRHVALRQAL